MTENNVRFRDTLTGKVFSMPISELTPECVCVQVAGGYEFWEFPDQVKQREYLNPPFSRRVRKLLAEIQETFWDVRPQSLDEWEDGFRRWMDAEVEIDIWLDIAKVYRQFTDGRNLTLDEKRDIYHVLLGCAYHGGHVLRTVGAPTLSSRRKREIMNAFRGTS
jgi:hypothetical protein